MGEVLPKNWIQSNIGNVLDVEMGQSPPSSSYNDIGNGLPFMQGKTEFGDIFPTVVKFTNKPTKVVEANTVLLSVRAPIGPTNIALERMCIGRGLAGISSNIFPKNFILYYFRAFEKELDSLGTGTTFKAISGNNIKNFPFLVPPLAEQERIVAKLDTLFAQHEAIKKALERIPQLLKDFRQQVLTQAVTGKLTEEWRKGKVLASLIELTPNSHRYWKYNLPEDWLLVSFDQAAIIKSNLVNPDLYLDYILIAPDNLETDTGKIINKPIVSEIKPISGKHLFESGSIIYSKIRPYLNKLAIVNFRGLCSADMYPISNSELTVLRFVFYYMISNEFLNYSTTAGERSVLPKINQKGLNEIPFPLPTTEEQQEIVSRVESLFAKADKIEERYKALKAKVATLPQAILHKAFKGELVPQLPTDGHAKDLLAEIMALKNQVKNKK